MTHSLFRDASSYSDGPDAFADAKTPFALADGVAREFLLHHSICPVGYDADGALIVLIAPNAIVDGASDLEIAYNAPVVMVQSTDDEVQQAIERLMTRSEREIELLDFAREDPTVGEGGIADVRDLALQPPVVRYVNLLVRDAHESRASDIHLDAKRNGLLARYRVDGVLSPALDPPAEMQHAVVSRVKLMAELDIAERRRPQDGRIRVRLEMRDLDLRVSTVPTMHGESVVLRLLDRGGRPVRLGELGMSPAMLTQIEEVSARAHGLVIVTGPTGSGKTTTLHSALQHRSSDREKIIAVEDPIEYEVPGITQVPVHANAGLTFASVLRSILRQDPDVLMIGEMRDADTAAIAVQAAMTGHLVFSTLHTNDAISAIVRLVDLGVQEYLIAATVETIVAQRLVRRICTECCEEYVPPADIVRAIAGTVLYDTPRLHGIGCRACRGTGYRGRIGLFELLSVTAELKDAINRRASRTELEALARASGWAPLRSDAWSKVEAGLTTVEEVARVVDR